ncbi:MAG: hypothetical protein JWO56_426 [Acidobacteria bacterium]|nr:hypothetical protein [Acidobacteriota bacterium]
MPRTVDALGAARTGTVRNALAGAVGAAAGRERDGDDNDRDDPHTRSIPRAARCGGASAYTPGMAKKRREEVESWSEKGASCETRRDRLTRYLDVARASRSKATVAQATMGDAVDAC